MRSNLSSGAAGRVYFKSLKVWSLMVPDVVSRSQKSPHAADTGTDELPTHTSRAGWHVHMFPLALSGDQQLRYLSFKNESPCGLED